jgi:hypothetical protein
MGELMSAHLASDNVEIPQVMVIPTLFIPLIIIDGPTPLEAWQIVRAVVDKFPDGRIWGIPRVRN